MNLQAARDNIGARVARYENNRAVQFGVITGIWSKRGWVYVRFDGKSGAHALDPQLLELSPAAVDA